MKKFLLILPALFCLTLLCSCGKINGIPEGEYELTVVEDYPSILCEPLKKSYKPGETVIVKTSLVYDASYRLTINGEKAIKHELVQDENGRYSHYEWEFTMPSKNSIIEVQWHSGMDDYYYKLTINDPDNLVINSFPSEIADCDTVEINTLRSDLYFVTSPVINIENPKAVKNSHGEILYYSWSFEMPAHDLTINVEVSMYEPILWDFEFVNHTGIDNMFLTEFQEEYAEGETIEIGVNPDLLIEDRGIILKANGVLIEESGIYEWTVAMPSEPLKIDAYLINASFGENWKYLNVIDKNGLLAQAADGYYQVGSRVVIYTDYVIDIICEDGVQINGLCVDEGEGVTEYIYSFEMINQDLTIEISNRK